jgi:hypothetical protein
MGRPKGAKNRRTLLREAEQKLHSVNREDFLDAMIVLEESMRHFYIRAVQLKTANGNPKEIDDNLLKAVDIAEKVMPYRHHRLAAIKLDKDPVTNWAFCDIDHFLGCTMRTICECKGRFGQFLPGPNEAHDYEPQAYSHPGVSFDGHGVYWLVRPN